MEYYNNILCIEGGELIQLIGKKSTYDNVRQKSNCLRLGGNGRTALIEVASLPTKWRMKVMEMHGDAEKSAAIAPFIKRLKADAGAVEFFGNYELQDGRQLPELVQREYCSNAMVLNAIEAIMNDQLVARKSLGSAPKGFWQKALATCEAVKKEVGHSLPATENRLRLKYKEYKENGYEALISGKWCNQNTRKVTGDIEKLLMSLYTMPNKPFAADVKTLYDMFLQGKIQVVDAKTGEIFKPEQFRKPTGEFITVSETTVWNYLNAPHNRVIVDAVRSGGFQFNNAQRPHHHRTAPVWGFSKVSMDDRDLPRKLTDGNRVKAYYAYDVASGCVVGASYSRKKDETLFIDCLRDMFRLIDRQGWGMPLEVEVENHLVSKFFDDLAIMFPYVRICNPGNSQEKHAEHLNRAKKYGVEKGMGHTNGRWWSKHEAYREDAPKSNDEYQYKGFTFERLVADDKQACANFNNMPHPNQKKYPGLTRWQVLCQNINPAAPQVSKAVVYKTIGEKTVTTINRNQYVTVQHDKYMLPGLEVLSKLGSNNHTVEAYYLPELDGEVKAVYLYQNGTYLCKCEKITRYSTAKAEWGADDADAYNKQAAYVGRFDGYTKAGKEKLAKAVVLPTEAVEAAVSAPVETISAPAPIEGFDIDALLKDYNPAEYANRGLSEL